MVCADESRRQKGNFRPEGLRVVGLQAYCKGDCKLFRNRSVLYEVVVGLNKDCRDFVYVASNLSLRLRG